MPPAGLQWADIHSCPHIYTACSLGAQKSLVSGKAENINIHLLNVNIKYSGSLGGIYHKKDPLSLAAAPIF